MGKALITRDKKKNNVLIMVTGEEKEEIKEELLIALRKMRRKKELGFCITSEEEARKMPMFIKSVNPIPVPKKSGEEVKKVLYLCDGKGECSGKGECYKIGGHCRRTYDINHAKNFHKFMGKGDFLEDEPEQSSVVKEIRGKHAIKIEAVGLTRSEKEIIRRAIRKIEYGRKTSNRLSLPYSIELK